MALITPFWASGIRSHFGLAATGGWLSQLAPSSATSQPGSGNLPGLVPWATANSGGRLADNNRWRWMSSFSGSRWTSGLVRLVCWKTDNQDRSKFFNNSSADAVHGLVAVSKGAQVASGNGVNFTYTITPTDTSGPYCTATVEVRSKTVGTGSAYYFNRWVLTANAGDNMWKFIAGSTTDLNHSSDPMSGWHSAGYVATDAGTVVSGDYCYINVLRRNP